MKINRKRCFSN